MYLALFLQSLYEALPFKLGEGFIKLLIAKGRMNLSSLGMFIHQKLYSKVGLQIS